MASTALVLDIDNTLLNTNQYLFEYLKQSYEDLFSNGKIKQSTVPYAPLIFDDTDDKMKDEVISKIKGFDVVTYLTETFHLNVGTTVDYIYLKKLLLNKDVENILSNLGTIHKCIVVTAGNLTEVKKLFVTNLIYDILGIDAEVKHIKLFDRIYLCIDLATTYDQIIIIDDIDFSSIVQQINSEDTLPGKMLYINPINKDEGHKGWL